jgi:hypothetical protein
LLNGVGEMDLADVKDHSIDSFGGAYEYFMTMYASNAGKSGGEFFLQRFLKVFNSDMDKSVNCEHRKFF